MPFKKDNFIKQRGAIAKLLLSPVLCILLMYFFNTSISAAGSDKIKWNLNLSTVSLDYYGAAYGNGVYVTVGGHGIIKTSNDGKNWNIRVSQLSENSLNDVIWGGKKFIAVGDNGLILVSSNGVKWTKVYSGTDSILSDIVWNGRQYVIVGFTGVTLTSKDGLKWTKSLMGINFCMESVTWDGKRFLAAGSDEMIYSSKDGKKWTKIFGCGGKKISVYSIDGSKIGERSDPPYSFKGIEYGNGIYVAVTWYHGYIAVSKDGVNWRYISPSGMSFFKPTSMEEVSWDGKEFIAVGQMGILTSSDGVKWSNVKPYYFTYKVIRVKDSYFCTNCGDAYVTNDLAVDTGTLRNANFCDIAWNGKVYVALDTEGYVAVSSDGAKWSFYPIMIASERTEMFYNFKSVEWVGKKFVVTGPNGFLYTSVDGIKWKRVPLDTKNNLYNPLTIKNTVAVFDDYGGIYYSLDGGDNWISSDVGRKVNGFSVMWDGKEFAGVDSKNNIFISKDLVNWTCTQYKAKESLHRVIWDGKKYIAYVYGDQKSYIYSSLDASKWTLIKELNVSRAIGMEWNGKQYVIVGDYGEYAYSNDGVQWKTGKVKVNCRFASLLFKGGRFMALNSSGNILISSNGSSWNMGWVNMDKLLTDVLWDGKRYIVVGEWGTLVTGNVLN